MQVGMNVELRAIDGAKQVEVCDMLQLAGLFWTEYPPPYPDHKKRYSSPRNWRHCKLASATLRRSVNAISLVDFRASTFFCVESCDSTKKLFALRADENESEVTMIKW